MLLYPFEHHVIGNLEKIGPPLTKLINLFDVSHILVVLKDFGHVLRPLGRDVLIVVRHFDVYQRWEKIVRC